MTDGVYSNLTGDVRLTTAYGINAAYDHYWTKQFKTSAYGFYGQISYDSAANNAICQQQSLVATTAGATRRNRRRAWLGNQSARPLPGVQQLLQQLGPLGGRHAHAVQLHAGDVYRL